MEPEVRRRAIEQIGAKAAQALMSAAPQALVSRHDLTQKWGVLPDDERHFFWGIRQTLQSACRDYESAGAGMIRITGYGQESVLAALGRSYGGAIASLRTGVGALERMRPAAPTELRPKIVDEQAQLAKLAQQSERMTSQWRKRWGLPPDERLSNEGE
jgi:hypothetical protein